MKEIVTNDGKKGGWLKGKPHYDKNGKSLGGIKAIVTDSSRPVELEGGEVIINKEASAKHWKELSRINQSAGNGVAIGPPSGDYDEDPEEYKEGGKVIEFNANHVPNKWILNYAKNIKEKHPEIWKLGGNIFGNQAFINLKRVSERGYWLDSEKWMYIKWRSYVARHKKDFRIEGVVAMLKWVDKVDKGWAYMKNLIEERIDKIEDKKEGKGWKHKMKKGGKTIAQTPEQKIDNLPKGKMFEDAKNIESVFKKSSHSWSEVIELFEKNRNKGQYKIVNLLDIKITQPNIQSNKAKKIISNIDRTPIINVVEFNNGDKVIFDGHHRLIANWAIGNSEIKVNLVKAESNNIFKTGGRAIAQTPAPKKERIYGSKVNKPQSAASESKAKSIKLSEAVIESIKNKIKGTGISLATAKAVVRRGMGAYSSSHRPTITGGKPNSRVAWGLARLNAFLYKAEHKKSKSGKYTQDDDLLRESGFKVSKMGDGGEVNGLNIIIKNIGDHSKKYFGVYKKIFDIIEENIAFYEPYGTSYEEIKGNDFYITITPYPEQFIIDKISKLKNVEIVNSFYLGGNIDYEKGGQTFYERTYADGTKKRFSVDKYEKNIYPYLPLGNGGNVDIAEWETKEPELFKCLLTIRALVEANAVVKDSFIDTRNNLYVINYEDSNPYFNPIITETCKTLTECEDYLEVDEVEVTDKFVLVPLVKNTDTRYAEGGELAKGIKTEQEHRKTLEKIASGELSVDQAIERTAKDHLKEDPKYYTKLLKMESKMAFGGVLEPGLEGKVGRINKNIRILSIADKTVTFLNLDTDRKRIYPKEDFIRLFEPFSTQVQPQIQQKVMPSSVSILPIREGDYFTLEGTPFTWAKVIAIGEKSMQVTTGDDKPLVYRLDNVKEWIDKGELKVIPDPTKIVQPEQAVEATEKAEDFDYTSLFDTEKFVPSTERKTWNAVYNVGDKVRIRVDMSMNVNIPYDSPGNEFTIQRIDKSAATPFKLDKSGDNVGGLQRPENPTGVLYILDKKGGSWEGKDLELISKGTGVSKPSSKPSAQAKVKLEKPKPVENALARLDKWEKVNMTDVLPFDEEMRVKKALADLALSLSVPTKSEARADSQVIFDMLNKK